MREREKENSLRAIIYRNIIIKFKITEFLLQLYICPFSIQKIVGGL